LKLWLDCCPDYRYSVMYHSFLLRYKQSFVSRFVNTFDPKPRVKTGGSRSNTYGRNLVVLFLPRPPNRVRKLLCNLRSFNSRRVEWTRRRGSFYISWRQYVYG
jgi:hypothetical protein